MIKKHLQHLGRNSHDTLCEFLIHGSVFGIIVRIVESLPAKFVLKFVKNCKFKRNILSVFVVWLLRVCLEVGWVFLRTFANHVGAFACAAGSLTLYTCVVHAAACGVHACVVSLLYYGCKFDRERCSPKIGCCSIFGGD